MIKDARKKIKRKDWRFDLLHFRSKASAVIQFG